MERNPEFKSSDIMCTRQHFQRIEAGSKEQIRPRQEDREAEKKKNMETAHFHDTGTNKRSKHPFR
jgi:hypothetical protein